ncbi:MAG: hypothetical protein LC650_04700, partial [Actinobacteria bacterium]|nr:hypothetical protein [Actinomycetota bacterium]
LKGEEFDAKINKLLSADIEVTEFGPFKIEDLFPDNRGQITVKQLQSLDKLGVIFNENDTAVSAYTENFTRIINNA